MEPITSHYVAPIEMTRAEFRAICERVDAGENLDGLLTEYKAARA